MAQCSPIDNIILNLKMIAKIPEFGRIYYKNGCFVVEEYSFLQGVKRFVSGYNRMQSINEINELIEKAFEKNYSLLMSSKEPKNRETIKMILSELKNCIKGLQNLTDSTYKNDYSVNSLIELYILKIETHVSEINSFLGCVNPINPNNSPFDYNN